MIMMKNDDYMNSVNIKCRSSILHNVLYNTNRKKEGHIDTHTKNKKVKRKKVKCITTAAILVTGD